MNCSEMRGRKPPATSLTNLPSICQEYTGTPWRRCTYADLYIRNTHTFSKAATIISLNACWARKHDVRRVITRTMTTTDQAIKSKSRGKRRFILFSILAGACSGFTLTDTAQDGYTATIRSLRVFYALVRNVRE